MPPHAQAFGPLSTTRITVKGVSFDMVRVPPGRFVDSAGSSKRTLLVSRPFQIGVTPVTQALWRAVTGKRPSRFRGNDRPVEKVSWHDVQTFLARLEALGLHGFRLPTEVEWLWAAYCGASTRFAGADRANPVAVVNKDETAPVGSLLPSAAGVLDLSGNVFEWQQDRWTDMLAAGVDVQGPALGTNRALRGGAWDGSRLFAQPASSLGIDPDYRGGDLGVRLLRTAS